MRLGGVRRVRPAGAHPPPPPPVPVGCAPGPQFDIFTTAANPIGTRPCEGRTAPAADVAVLRWKRHLFHHKKLESASRYERRLKDDRTVLVVEVDNFGDIGTNLSGLSGSGLPPPMVLLLGAGGAAVLWFGARPAFQDVFAGVKNYRILKREQAQLREKYRTAIADLLRSDASRNFTREQRRELLNLAVWLTLSRDESASERGERIVSGLLVAPGSTLTGVGTFLAPGFIFSHNATLAFLSNLFTGWAGNGPIAAYAVINAIASTRQFRTAGRRLACVKRVDLNKTWPGTMDLNKLVQGRLELIRHNAALTGASAVGIAVGGVLTAVTLVGYAVMIPFAFLRAAAEYRERRKISYTRRLFIGEHDYTTRRDLLSDLIYAQKNHDVLKKVKNHTRERYPWGHSAPMPFNVAVRSWAAWRNRHKKGLVSPALRVQDAVKALRRSQIEWLTRKQTIALRDHRRLVQESSAAADPAQYTIKLRYYETLLDRLQARIVFLKEDRRAIKRDLTMDMYTTSGKAWVSRLINLFVEMQLFGPLSKAMYKDELLRHSIQHAVQIDAKKNIIVDAAKCLKKLEHRTLRQAWYEAFYSVCEDLLLTSTKTHFQELAREMSDLTTLRLWLSRHPESNPAHDLDPLRNGPAVWSPPPALPHPASRVLDSFVPVAAAPPAILDAASKPTVVKVQRAKTTKQAPQVTGAIFDAPSVERAAELLRCEE